MKQSFPMAIEWWPSMLAGFQNMSSPERGPVRSSPCHVFLLSAFALILSDGFGVFIPTFVGSLCSAS